eukprot:m.166619 g.166619  ORF g.166619 m.166619 type:complete len:905 (+) comp17174_c0_seq2:345-3059(+)
MAARSTLLKAHPVIDKAHVLKDLSQLLSRCEDTNAGILSQHFAGLQVLIRDALAIGLRASRLCLAPETHERRFVYKAVLDFLQIKADPHEPSVVAAMNVHDTRDKDLAAVCAWVAAQVQAKSIVATLEMLLKDEERVASFYHRYSLMANKEDCKAMLDILARFCALPILSAAEAQLLYCERDSAKNIVFAKNNVVVIWNEKDSSQPSYLSGYVCITSKEKKDPDDSRCIFNALRLTWTPNSHFSGQPGDSVPSTSDIPLPPGWDSGYDPVTGFTYYINHNTCKTTWRDPRVLEVDRSQSSSLDCMCAEDMRVLQTNATAHACSLVMDLLQSDPLVIRTDPETEDCGRFDFNTPVWVCGGIRKTNALTIYFNRGGYGSFLAVLQRCKGCVLVQKQTNIASPAPESPDRPQSAPISTGNRQRNLTVKLRARRNETQQEIYTTRERPEPTVHRWKWPYPEKPGAVDLEGWKSFFNAEGVCSDWSVMRKMIFFRGLTSDVRPLAYKFLLGMYPLHSTEAERHALYQTKSHEYFHLKDQWMAMSSEEGADLRIIIADIAKDVARTDHDVEFYRDARNANIQMLLDILVTYSFLENSSPYAQGMSDLLSLLLVTIQDEVETFWCFAGLMRRMQERFSPTGMHVSLNYTRLLMQELNEPVFDFISAHDLLDMFFCYRWLLMEFRREFPLADVVHLWDVTLADYKTPQFALFAAQAVLDIGCKPLLKMNLDPGEVLEKLNSLTDKMDVQQVIQRGREMFFTFRQSVIPEELSDILMASNAATSYPGTPAGDAGAGERSRGGSGSAAGGLVTPELPDEKKPVLSLPPLSPEDQSAATCVAPTAVTAGSRKSVLADLQEEDEEAEEGATTPASLSASAIEEAVMKEFNAVLAAAKLEISKANGLEEQVEEQQGA